jgi:hypothetical protein
LTLGEFARFAEIPCKRRQAPRQGDLIAISTQGARRNPISVPECHVTGNEEPQRSKHLGVPTPVLASIGEASACLTARAVDPGEFALSSYQMLVKIPCRDGNTAKQLFGLTLPAHSLTVGARSTMQLFDPTLDIGKSGSGPLVVLLRAPQFVASPTANVVGLSARCGGGAEFLVRSLKCNQAAR